MPEEHWKPTRHAIYSAFKRSKLWKFRSSNSSRFRDPVLFDGIRTHIGKWDKSFWHKHWSNREYSFSCFWTFLLSPTYKDHLNIRLKRSLRIHSQWKSCRMGCGKNSFTCHSTARVQDELSHRQYTALVPTEKRTHSSSLMGRGLTSIVNGSQWICFGVSVRTHIRRFSLSNSFHSRIYEYVCGDGLMHIPICWLERVSSVLPTLLRTSVYTDTK